MKEKLCCKECGQSLRSFWHSLSDKLARALRTFYACAGNAPKNLNSVGFDFSSRANFQKLAFWGLVVKCGGGEWQITARGVQWLRGQITVPKKVYTVQNRVERVGKTEVFISDVLKQKEGWQKEWKSVRLPVRKQEKQRGLF